MDIKLLSGWIILQEDFHWLNFLIEEIVSPVAISILEFL